MKMFIFEKSVFNNGNKPLVKELEFDSKCACDRNLFIEQIESWLILFKYFISSRGQAHKPGTKIEVKFTFEF